MPNNHRKFVKVRKEGGSRVLALTPFIPPNWKMVKVEVRELIDSQKGKVIWLRLEKVV